MAPLLALSVQLAWCDSSGAYNFEVAPRFLWQFTQPWLQSCQIRHFHCGVAEHSYLLECDAMTGPRQFQGTCVYFLHLRRWSSKRRPEFFTACPLHKKTLGYFEVSQTIHPKTRCHIWEDLNHYIWDTLHDECEDYALCHLVESLCVGLKIRPRFITLSVRNWECSED